MSAVGAADLLELDCCCDVGTNRVANCELGVFLVCEEVALGGLLVDRCRCAADLVYLTVLDNELEEGRSDLIGDAVLGNECAVAALSSFLNEVIGTVAESELPLFAVGCPYGISAGDILCKLGEARIGVDLQACALDLFFVCDILLGYAYFKSLGRSLCVADDELAALSLAYEVAGHIGCCICYDASLRAGNGINRAVLDNECHHGLNDRVILVSYLVVELGIACLFKIVCAVLESELLGIAVGGPA